MPPSRQREARTVHLPGIRERHDRLMAGLKAGGMVSVLRGAGIARLAVGPAIDRGRPCLPCKHAGLGRRADASGRGRDCSQCRVASLGGVTVPVVLENGAAGPWRISRHPIRPVLKHGPRSLTCTRANGCGTKPRGAMKVKVPIQGSGVGSLPFRGGAPPARLDHAVGEA